MNVRRIFEPNLIRRARARLGGCSFTACPAWAGARCVCCPARRGAARLAASPFKRSWCSGFRARRAFASCAPSPRNTWQLTSKAFSISCLQAPALGGLCRTNLSLSFPEIPVWPRGGPNFKPKPTSVGCIVRLCCAEYGATSKGPPTPQSQPCGYTALRAVSLAHLVRQLPLLSNKESALLTFLVKSQNSPAPPKDIPPRREDFCPSGARCTEPPSPSRKIICFKCFRRYNYYWLTIYHTKNDTIT